MTDHCAAETCLQAAEWKRSEDDGAGESNRGRRKRKGSFTVLSHSAALTRSESRVGRVRTGTVVIKEKSHCFGRHWPAGSLPASSES